MTIIDHLTELVPELNRERVLIDLCPYDFFTKTLENCDNDHDEDCLACWNQPFNEKTMSKTDRFNHYIDRVKAEDNEKKLADVMNETGYVMNTDNPNVKEKPIHRPEYDENKVTVKPGDTFNVSSSDSSSSVTRTGMIKDSGARREFETGAVRDIQEGKGRCDLLPLDVVARFRGLILTDISKYQETGRTVYLESALQRFMDKHANREVSTTFLEVSKHFEEGAKKYGEYNWQKGIPTHCYIDSAVRHYLKYLRGDKDEPHDRAFVWNILCCIWTCIHKPELNDYAAKATCEDTPQLKKEEKTGVPKITGNPDHMSTFNIKVTMKERWVDHFCSMLKRMERDGNRGHSEIIGFMADGDGDFHPHFEIDRLFEEVSGHEQKERIPVEVVFDAG